VGVGRRERTEKRERFFSFFFGIKEEECYIILLYFG